MSLINKMLKDLEKQRGDVREDVDQQSALLGLNAGVFKKRQQRKSIILLGVMVVLAIAVVIYFYLPSSQKRANKISMTAVSTKASPAPKMVVKEVTPEPIIQFQQYEFKATKSSATLQLDFDRAVHYTVQHQDNNQRLIIVFTNTKLNTHVQPITTNQWVKSLIFKPQHDSLVLTVSLRSAIALHKLYLSKQQSNIKIEFQHAVKVEQGKTSISKQPVPLSPKQQAQQLYDSAVDLISSGNKYIAVSKLRSALSLMPGFDRAREALVALLLEQGQKQEASKILTQGLVINPDNTNFVKLQVRVLASQHQIPRALSIMQQHNPSIMQDPNYYALMAVLYQRAGQYMLAARIYDQLTKVFPAHSLWWTGLGVALDSGGAKNAAQEAFREALKGDMRVSQKIRAYILSKINN